MLSIEIAPLTRADQRCGCPTVCRQLHFAYFHSPRGRPSPPCPPGQSRDSRRTVGPASGGLGGPSPMELLPCRRPAARVRAGHQPAAPGPPTFRLSETNVRAVQRLGAAGHAISRATSLVSRRSAACWARAPFTEGVVRELSRARRRPHPSPKTPRDRARARSGLRRVGCAPRWSCAPRRPRGSPRCGG